MSIHSYWKERNQIVLSYEATVLDKQGYDPNEVLGMFVG